MALIRKSNPSGITKASQGKDKGTNYRVGYGADFTTSRILHDYGINIRLIGSMTPQQCRAMALKTEELKRQLEMGKVYAKNAEAQITLKNELEKIRLELLKAGADGVEATDKLVAEGMVRNAQHGEHLKSLHHETQGNLRAVQNDGNLERQTFSHALGLKLRGAARQHQLKRRNATTQQQKGIHQAEFREYINGRGTNEPSGNGSGGGVGGFFRRWFS